MPNIEGYKVIPQEDVRRNHMEWITVVRYDAEHTVRRPRRRRDPMAKYRVAVEVL